MGLMDKAALHGITKAAEALKPFLESIHSRLELQNVQLARIEVLLNDPKKPKGNIDEDTKKLLAELEAGFK